MKVKQDMNIYEILVPTVMDGKPIHTRFHRVWDKKVREITGGLSIHQPIKGHWVNPEDGELFIERMIPVRIACTAGEMEQIARITLVYYKQDTVMYYKISDEVWFLSKNREAGA